MANASNNASRWCLGGCVCTGFGASQDTHLYKDIAITKELQC